MVARPALGPTRRVGRTRLSGLLAVVAALAAAAAGCSAERPDGRGTPASRAAPGSPGASLTLGLPRAVHRATALPDGRVLLTGGCSQDGCAGVDAAATSVLVDPSTGAVSEGPRLQRSRLGHTATLLPDGRVLLVGGYGGEGVPPTGTVEVLDPARGSSVVVTSLRVPRADHTAALLPDGRVLVAGGSGVDGRTLRSVELVDASAGVVADGPDLPEPRAAHVATSFGDRLLLVGGATVSDDAVATTVTFDPARSAWFPGPTMRRARLKHAAVTLGDGTVLVVGGSATTESRDAFADTEVLTPGGATSRPGPDLPQGRYKLADAVVVLRDGRVAVAGGPALAVVDVARSHVQTVPTPSLGQPRAFQTASAVGRSAVLVAGGYDSSITPTADAWLVPVPSAGIRAG